MRKIGIFIIIFLIIIAVIFLALGLFSSRDKKVVLDSNNQNSDISNQEQGAPEEDKSIIEIITDFLDIGSRKKEGSEEDSTNQDSPQTMGQISYSIRNFEQNSFCNQHQGLDCIDKTSDCSLIAENLDNQITGIFEIRFTFSDLSNQELSSDIISYSVNPGNNQTFASSFNIQGQEANQDIKCSYTTLKIPEKII